MYLIIINWFNYFLISDRKILFVAFSSLNENKIFLALFLIIKNIVTFFKFAITFMEIIAILSWCLWDII